MSAIDEFKKSGARSSLTDFHDPFAGSNIVAMHTHIIKNSFKDGFSITGIIEFKNKNTSGTQKFQEKSWDELIISMSKFIEEVNEGNS